MTYKVKLTTAALTGFMFAASIAQAQEAKPETGDMPMTGTQHMKGDMANMKEMDGMEGMMPMMKMMGEMEPMMEACQEMMQSMNEHMEAPHTEDQKG